MRWADMDLQGHINNVTYLDYLQEARIDMLSLHDELRGGEDQVEGVVVVRHEIQYAAPLVFRREPILVETWVTEVRASRFTMAYEIFSEHESGRVVYLRATSVLAAYRFADEMPRRISASEREVLERYLEPAEPSRPLVSARVEPPDGPRDEYSLKVRWSDVDAYGHVNNVKYVEFFQEARVNYLRNLHHKGEKWSGIVVARIDLTYLRPMLFRSQPYAVHSWVSHVGTKSFTISAEVRDGDQVLAKAAVLIVSFDVGTQRSAPLTDVQRERLAAELPDV